MYIHIDEYEHTQINSNQVSQRQFDNFTLSNDTCLTVSWNSKSIEQICLLTRQDEIDRVGTPLSSSNSNMTLEIYQDEEVDPPERVRRVSFATASRAPLTPHMKNRNKTRRKNLDSSTKLKQQQQSTMENGKENQQSGMTSLRRQLRATMSPTPMSNHNKENGIKTKRTSLFTATAPSSGSGKSTVLTPSLRHNTRQSSKSLKTPKSLLKRELAFNDAAEESLLISPGDAFSLLVDTPARPRLKSPFETVHEVKIATSSEEKEQEYTAVVVEEDKQEEETPGNDNFKPAATSDGTATTTNDPRMTEKAQQRALLRQQRSLQPVEESRQETGTTPYRARGNGVQMDLSSMFTEIASPETSDVHSIVKSSTRRKEELKSKESIPTNERVASLDNLRESLWLDFGDERHNQVGSTKTLSFVVEAPAESSCVVEVERVPFKKGFDLVIDEGATVVETNASASSKVRPTAIRLSAREQVLIKVSWTPVESGGVREVIYLKLPRGRLCVVVHGKARGTKPAKGGVVVRRVSDIGIGRRIIASLFVVIL